MRLVKKINTSAVMCVDDDGRQLVALGKGLGFLEPGAEVPLSRVDRTFYDVDNRYVDAIGDISREVLDFSSQLVDAATGLLSYPLSPNLPLILADHISFAIKRAREGIQVRMPLAFDVRQQYPLEYRLGELAVDRLNRMFSVRLPKSEAAGIAMAFVNNATQASIEHAASDETFDRLLERSVRAIERVAGVDIDRESFNFTRFATHMQYLFQRAAQGETIESGNAGMYGQVSQEYPEVASCVDAVSGIFRSALGHELSDEERLYLLLHINRIVVKASDEAGGGGGASSSGASSDGASGTNATGSPTDPDSTA